LNNSDQNRSWLMRLPVADACDDSSNAAKDGDGQRLELPQDTLGLSISGEGVRAAAFGLGVLQALARADWLRHVDYLSTVAGGGYVGSFLGRYFDSYRMRRGEPDPTPGVVQDRVSRGLIDRDSAPVAWLRRHSSYLGGDGRRDAAQNLGVYVTTLLSFYVVLGAFFLAVFGIIDAVGFLSDQLLGRDRFSESLKWLLQLCSSETLPIGQHLHEEWRGPWLVLAEGSLWLAVIPLMLAYWLSSQDIPGSFVAPALIAAAIVAGTALLLWGTSIVLIVLLASVGWVLASWDVAQQEEGPADERHPYRRTLAREHLNRLLAFWATATYFLLVLWFVDRIGRLLAVIPSFEFANAPTAGQWLGMVVAILLALTLVVRMAVRALPTFLFPVTLSAFGLLPLLVAMSFVGHSMYGVGQDFGRGLTITVVATTVSLLLGTREFLPLVNRSGTFSVRAGRLARMFLGAVNPARRVHPEGRNVTRPVAGDDVTFDLYQPESVGGPLHLINCAVLQTLDVDSFRGAMDCGAKNLAVGPAGISVARDGHALWTSRSPLPRSLRPLGTEAPDPFLRREKGLVCVDPLGLEDWIAISGANPGSGEIRRSDQHPFRWEALSSLRSGYWWDSGLDSHQRSDTPLRSGLLVALGSSITRLFRSQSLLMSELVGMFAGPWTRHWYLTSGANFDPTGAFELLRRRLPFIIICDACADPERLGSALVTLVRLARTDLGAEVQEIDHDQLDALGLPTAIAEQLGSLGDLLTSPKAPSSRHAALLRFHYPEPPPGNAGDAYFARRESWVLYLKSSCNGDEPMDILADSKIHPEFPDERTAETDFNQQQWETYRRLGEHIGDGLFNELTEVRE
jgi:hypothetical protein